MPTHNSPSSSRQRLAIENDEYSDDSGDDRHSVDREDWSANHQVVVSNQKFSYWISGQHLKLAEIGIKTELEKLTLTRKQTEVDLLNHFIRLEPDYKVGGTPTKQARVFYCGTVIPILGCFRNHHFSDSKAYEAH
jgi:hypothetical protein